MKLIQLVLLLVCSSFSLHLSGQDCLWFASEQLNVNNIDATIRMGDLWWDGSNGKYFAPNDGSEITSIFAGGLWIAGIDPGGSLKMSGTTFGGSLNSSYWPGPLDDATGIISEPECTYWDRMFPIEFDEVIAHVQDFADNNVIDGPVPENILGWPGRGNPDFFGVHEFLLPNQDLAPFWDRDGDGIYEPMEGDYPLMKGIKAFWWVFNDLGNSGDFSGNPAQVEIQAMAFAYASTDSYINNTTFYEFKLINKATEILDSSYVSLWVDPDLGCYEDDFVGCSPADDLAYIYNSDDFDEDCFVPGYGEDIPVLGIKILRGLEDDSGQGPGFSNFMYYSNPAFPGPPGTGGPNLDIEVYGLMSGTWLDGTPLTQGGSGYDPGNGQPPYNYAFDGSDVNGTPWTMCDLEFMNSDYRMLITSGPATFEPGDAKYFSFAVVWEQGLDYPCPDLSDFIDGTNAVEDFYNNIDQTPTGVHAVFVQQELAEVFPNPVGELLQIQTKDPSVQLERLEFFNSSGQQIYAVEGQHREQITLSTGDWSSGVYFYRLWTSKGQLQTGKLIVQ